MAPFPLALDKLKRLNAFVLSTPELANFFVRGDYNFLQIFQLQLLQDILAHTQPSAAVLGPRSTASGVRARQIIAAVFSVLSYIFLVLSRRKILLYAADKATVKSLYCDFRMENLYRSLYKSRVHFVEVLHTIFRKDFIGNLTGRSRPVIYLEVVDIFCRLFGRRSGGLPPGINFSAAGADAVLFKSLLNKYTREMPRSRFRIRAFRLLLKCTAVRTLFATADTRNYTELVAACRSLGIKTYGFQNGNITKYDVGYLDCGGPEFETRPATFFVETGYWKQELLRLGTYFKEDDLVVGGNMKEDYVPSDEKSAKTNGPLTVLIPYEIVAPKEEILAYIKKLLTYPEVAVIFKFRADRDLAEQTREYGLGHVVGNLRLVTDLKDVPHFDIAAGTYSTFLYEMIGKGRPVAYLKTSLDYGEGLVINGLADPLGLDDSNLLQRLSEIKNTKAEILQQRRDKLYGNTVMLADTLDTILY